jgi:hypothetical protein
MKHTLKAPGTKRLKLKYDEPLLKFAFKLNLCRYSMANMMYSLAQFDHLPHRDTMVGRCRLTHG